MLLDAAFDDDKTCMHGYLPYAQLYNQKTYVTAEIAC